jgi:hypothetical protein
MKYFASFFCFFLLGCNNKETLFIRLSSSHTGISFNNKIVENDSINPLDLEFLYNGGGVAVVILIMMVYLICILRQAPIE